MRYLVSACIRSFLFSKASLNLGRPAQTWNPPGSLEDRLQRGCKTSSFWHQFWPLAISVGICNMAFVCICWVLDPNTWLSPATSATVSYLKWAYTPPLLSRHLHLLVAPARATPCWIWGGLKVNTIISSPFRMSKMNLPVRYWKPIFHNRLDRALKPTPNGSKGGSRQHGGTRMHSALGQLVNYNRRLVACGFENIWNRIHNHIM